MVVRECRIVVDAICSEYWSYVMGRAIVIHAQLRWIFTGVCSRSDERTHNIMLL